MDTIPILDDLQCITLMEKYNIDGDINDPRDGKYIVEQIDRFVYTCTDAGARNRICDILYNIRLMCSICDVVSERYYYLETCMKCDRKICDYCRVNICVGKDYTECICLKCMSNIFIPDYQQKQQNNPCKKKEYLMTLTYLPVELWNIVIQSLYETC